MNTPDRKIEWVIWGGLIATMLVILAAVIIMPMRGTPPPIYGSLPDFALQDQNNHTVRLADLRGDTWIADVIFTRCPGQCLILSGHMKEIQAALPADAPVKLVSFTTDPSFDTPAVLKKYARNFGADDHRWIFLTGDKSVLRRATVEGMKLAVLDKPPGQQTSPTDLFIHSDKFVLIDRTGHLRGWFDGENPDSVGQVVSAAKILARE